MSKTNPIRDLNNIKKLKNYFLQKKELRNYVLIILGLNTALRISDILKLKWKDVYNMNEKIFFKHVTIKENKTKKTTCIALNHNVVAALKTYMENISPFSVDDYIIKSRTGDNRSITRNRAYTIIRNAANNIGLEGVISCHSLRKTFGYQAWKQGIPPALLMSIYNHSSIEITKIYLAIDQDDKDNVFYNLNL